MAVYQQKVDAGFWDDPLTRFLHVLRNYLLHVSRPPVRSKMRVGHDSIEPVGIELSPQELLHWDRWSKPSIGFIEGYQDGIPLAELVADYERKVYHSCRWLLDHLKIACKSDLDEFWTKRKEWADYCERNGIPKSDEEWREYIETEQGGFQTLDRRRRSRRVRMTIQTSEAGQLGRCGRC